MIARVTAPRYDAASVYAIAGSQVRCKRATGLLATSVGRSWNLSVTEKFNFLMGSFVELLECRDCVKINFKNGNID